LGNAIERRILVTGGSGFIGSHLLTKLIEKKNTNHYPHHIRCLTRNKNSIRAQNKSEKDIEIIDGDLSYCNDCLNALVGIDIAYYLVHSIEGSTKN
jgi:uncharacterized protein YbjT (DUF2867 family)